MEPTVNRRLGFEAVPKGIVNAIEALYELSKSGVLLEDEISDWFCTHVGVRQGCLLLPTISNIYVESWQRH